MCYFKHQKLTFGRIFPSFCFVKLICHCKYSRIFGVLHKLNWVYQSYKLFSFLSILLFVHTTTTTKHVYFHPIYQNLSAIKVGGMVFCIVIPGNPNELLYDTAKAVVVACVFFLHCFWDRLLLFLLLVDSLPKIVDTKKDAGRPFVSTHHHHTTTTVLKTPNRGDSNEALFVFVIRYT